MAYMPARAPWWAHVIFLGIAGGGMAAAIVEGRASWWPWFIFPTAAAVGIVWIVVTRLSTGR